MTNRSFPASWYKNFVRSASVAMICVETDTWSVVESNANAAALLGCDIADIPGLRITSFRRLHALLTRKDAPELVHGTITIPHVLKSNHTLEAQAWLSSHEGDPLVAAILRDTTKQRADADKELQSQSMERLGQLSMMVAHEIRNPLSAVNLHLQLLQRTAAEDEKSLRSIHYAMKGVERMTNIVSSTLDFAKPIAPKLSSCNIHALIIDTLELLQDSLFQKVVTLTFDFDESLPSVRADVTQLQTVFLHIFRNAYESFANKGTIHCSTRHVQLDDSSSIEVWVNDTGVGIPREDLGLIFNPFFSRKAEGIGLGLTVSKRILEHHHASLTVRSIRGKGTSVCMTFPGE